MSNQALKDSLMMVLEAIEEKRGDAKDPKTSRHQADVASVNSFILEYNDIYNELDIIANDPHLLKLNNDKPLPQLNKAQKDKVIEPFANYVRAAANNLRGIDPAILNRAQTRAWSVAKDEIAYYKDPLGQNTSRNSGKYGKKECHVVGSMNTVNRRKKELLIRSLDVVWKDRKITETARAEMIYRGAGRQRGGEVANIGFQVGHGDYGMAASGISALRAEQVWDQNTQDYGEDTQVTTKKGTKIDAVKEMKKITTRYKKQTGLKFTHEMVLDDEGNLRKDFFLILSLQSVAGNQAEAHDTEKAALDVLHNDIKVLKKLVFEQTSTSLTQGITAVLSEGMTKKTRRALAKGQKIKYIGHKPKRKIKEQGRTSGKDTRQVTDTSTVYRAKTLKKLGVAKAVNINKLNKKANAQGSKTPNQVDSISFLNRLNAKIEPKIIGNMGEPGLVNRTGRFANSVEALKYIKQQGKKWDTVQYTYDREHYGIFEMQGGNRRWATKARDPQTIIGRSLREVAAEEALGRFTLQRI